jgi:hypothetical protein
MQRQNGIIQVWFFEAQMIIYYVKLVYFHAAGYILRCACMDSSCKGYLYATDLQKKTNATDFAKIELPVFP